ncbi:MAG: hypothetical protein K940chlam3_01748 [Chlamydiae bacterium]|nr:hypothetical protein [Chlamydiota bacterium]
MSEENPLEPFLDQISEILKTYDENREKKLVGNPSEGDIADLMNIMGRVDAMKKAYEAAKKEQGLTEEDITKALQKDQEKATPKHRQILKKIESLRKDIHLEHKIIDKTLKEERRKKIQSGSTFKTKKKGKKTQKSLHISFRKGWKKM